MAEETGRPASTKLVSVSGLVGVAVLGAAVAAVVRLFGPGNVLEEVATELVASLGSTILVLAVFGLLFRTGLERLLRGAPGGEPLARSLERLEGLLQGAGAKTWSRKTPDSGPGWIASSGTCAPWPTARFPPSGERWRSCAGCWRIRSRDAAADRRPGAGAGSRNFGRTGGPMGPGARAGERSFGTPALSPLSTVRRRGRPLRT